MKAGRWAGIGIRKTRHRMAALGLAGWLGPA
jgi:hypothetical protein